MAINLLDTKNLLKLPLLRCKACDRRLQSPILQVGDFGNVCGSCFGTNPYTHMIPNSSLEALLRELYLPCNFAEDGCEFEGGFDDVCVHEKRCYLGRKKCPHERCENGLKRIDDLIEHMKSEHPKDVLTVVENYVSVTNPTESNLNVFYLLVADEMHFIIKGRLSSNKGHIIYSFYCLNYGVDIDHVKISIVLTYDDTIFNVENIQIKRLRKGELPYVLDEGNATKLKLSTLETFESLNNITVRVHTQKDTKLEQIDENTSFWHYCWQCSKYSNQINVCNVCFQLMTGKNCIDNHKTCQCRGATLTVNTGKICTKSTIPCTNVGCNEVIPGANHSLHITSQCQLRQLNCPFSIAPACTWKGAYVDLIAHITKDHTDLTNRNTCEMPKVVNTNRVWCFIKENNIFHQICGINASKQFFITTKQLNTPTYGDRYMWQIYLKHPVTRCETVISDNCTAESIQKIIDVSDYPDNHILTFKVVFRRINTFHNLSKIATE